MFGNISAYNNSFASLRQATSEVFWRAAPQKPIQNIIAAGAEYNSKRGLYIRDRIWLKATLQFCNQYNIPVSRKFKFTPINMANGQDILDPRLRLQADILVVCYVVNPDLFDPKDLTKRHEKHGAMFNVSPLHTKTAWAEAAQRMGARLIVTFNQAAEICSNDFVSLPGYVKGPQQSHQLEATLGNGQLKKETFKMETVFRQDLAHRHAICG